MASPTRGLGLFEPRLPRAVSSRAPSLASGPAISLTEAAPAQPWRGRCRVTGTAWNKRYLGCHCFHNQRFSVGFPRAGELQRYSGFAQQSGGVAGAQRPPPLGLRAAQQPQALTSSVRS